MGSQPSLTFQNFQVRSSFTFVIPEMLSQNNVQKVFRVERLVPKLINAEPMEQTLIDFSKGEPVFDYKKKQSYKDEFWAPYYNLLLTRGAIPHFPFKMTFKPEIRRVFDEKDLKSYDAELMCRLYLYGAVSLSIDEKYEFNKACTAQDAVNLMDQPITVKSPSSSSVILKQAEFLDSVRGNILKQIIKKTGLSPTTPCRPQNVVISPKLTSLPDKANCWNDIATFLAKSTNLDHIKKYTLESYSEQHGKPGQLIFFSPYTSLLLTPDLYSSNNDNGLHCLFERVSNVRELVSIQKEFINFYKYSVEAMIQDLNSKKGYRLSQFESFLHNWKTDLRRQLESLTAMLKLHEKLNWRKTGDWLRWYSAMMHDYCDDLQSFAVEVNELNTTNLNLGADVVGSINAFIDTVKKIKDLIPSAK